MLLEGVFVGQVAGQVLAKNGIIGGEVHIGTLHINGEDNTSFLIICKN